MKLLLVFSVVGLMVTLSGCNEMSYSDMLKEIPPCPESGLVNYTVEDLETRKDATNAEAAFKVLGYNATATEKYFKDGFDAANDDADYRVTGLCMANVK